MSRNEAMEVYGEKACPQPAEEVCNAWDCEGKKFTL